MRLTLQFNIISMKLPSKYMEDAVEQLATLPSIGNAVSFELERGMKGMNAVKVKKI